MTVRTWIRKLFAGPVTRPLYKAAAHRLRVEALDDRLVPAAYHVTSLLDDASAGTLRAAVTQANANPGADTIDFQVSGTISLSGSELPAISDDLTITAPAAGLTVDAHQASRILEVNAGATVGLSGLTLVNGVADEGGGIFNSGSLSLTACTLSGNLARLGGGIFNNGGTLGLEHVTLDSNTAQGGNGADSPYALHPGYQSVPGAPGQGAQGGALYNGGGAVTISNSAVTNNSARGGAGGMGGEVSSGLGGGAGGAGGAGAAAQGGGVSSIGGSLELINSAVSANSALGGTGGYGGDGVLGSVDQPRSPAQGGDGGAGGSAQGGGVFASGATAVTLTNSTLSGNVAQAGTYGNGGHGTFASGGSSGGQTGYGSGSPGQGGGLWAQGCASVTLTDSTVLQNTALGAPSGHAGGGSGYGAFGGCGGAGQGGGLCLDANGAVTLAQTTVALNTAEGGAGGHGGGGLTNGGIGGTGGPAQGGGMFLGQGGPATIVSTTFSGNTVRGGDGGNGGGSDGFGGAGGEGVDGQGGGAFVTAVSVNFIQTTLASNVAQGGNRGAGGPGDPAGGLDGIGGSGLGGGLFSTGTVALTNCTLADSASAAGSGTNPGLLSNPVSRGGNFYNWGSATLNNTLIADSPSGGDVYSPGSLVGRSSLIQDPSNQPLVDGVAGNIVGHDPLLGPLTMHGGPTATVPLLTGSPALNAGDPSLALDAQGNLLTADQRGAPFVRSYGAGVDIGAFEVQSPLTPRSLVVNTTADLLVGSPGVLSLREAIDLADGAPGSTITFDPAVFGTPQTIDLVHGELPVTAAMTITGPGARLLTIDADHRSRVLSIDDQTPAAIDVTISGLTLTRGNAKPLTRDNPNGGTGGAVDNAEDLTLLDSTISGSTAQLGGGIFNSGMLNLSGCTLSANVAAIPRGVALVPYTYYGFDISGFGGGICNVGTATLTNSTLAGNAADADYGAGGGLADLRTATLNNCTVWGNFADYGGGLASLWGATLNSTVVAGNVANTPPWLPANSLNDIPPDQYTGANNWIGGDPMLDPAGLRDDGGPTDTIALLPGSPLIDAGSSSSPLTTDQRGAGFPRAYGAAVDIGAYEFVPPNQPPTVARDQSAVAVNEGSPATATGTFNDPQGNGTVTLTASLGTITQDNATGTWSWSYTPTDGPNGPTTVTITATDGGGLTATITFTLTVNNVAPTATITGAPASGHSSEGTAISLGSTVSDPSSVDTAAGLTYAWTVTRNGAAYASGTAANFSFTPNDNGNYVVTLTGTDKDGGVSQAASATITVDNVAPTAGVSGPSDGVRGQARTFTLTASDPSSVDQAAGFTFTITWGDGAAQTVAGPSGTTVSHVYTATGTYPVKVTATDKDGGTSAAATTLDTITAVALETDPTDPSKTALVVGGTTSADTITIKPADAAGTLDVKIGTTDLGKFKPTGHLIVYGQSGDDTIKLQTNVVNNKTVYVTAPAFLFGGDGNDTLNASGSSPNNVLEGGAGNDTLQAGSGRDLLIGGTGADGLHGAAGGDILIGGTTDYDSNLTALNAIMAEWGRPDADYVTRVKHLSGTLGGGLNGGLLLTASTVHDDAAGDTLFGGSETDWFFALLSGTNKDVVKNQATGEVVTGL
jgi:fibronectin-binding autotransporter adhesin